MLKKIILIVAVIVMAIYGCKNISNDKAAPNKKTEPVIEAVNSEPDNVKDFEQLESQNKFLEEQVAAKDTEINTLKAELANAQGSVGNLQKEIESISDTKRNITYVLIISAVINVLLVIFIVWSRKQPKRLALPEGRASKDSDKNNDSSTVAKETTGENNSEVKIQSDTIQKSSDIAESTHTKKKINNTPKADSMATSTALKSDNDDTKLQADNAPKAEAVDTSPALKADNNINEEDTPQQTVALKVTDLDSEAAVTQDQNKRKRGRPFGSKNKDKQIAPPSQLKKRGRKPKNDNQQKTNKTTEETPTVKRGRGRPPKNKTGDTQLPNTQE